MLEFAFSQGERHYRLVYTNLPAPNTMLLYNEAQECVQVDGDEMFNMLDTLFFRGERIDVR